MTPADYYRLSWREYVQARLGWFTKRSFEFEHTRAIVYSLYCAHRGAGKAAPHIQEFWQLPTDPKIDKAAEEKRLKLIIKKTYEQFNPPK